ncbi:MAG: translation initiation factor IF-3 [candidate division Zixibacteria bacterium]|nr:translation initiation factor IF-3 [candidate division Zixibacteria bacterium]
MVKGRREPRVRINQKIRAPEVRLINADAEQVGIVSVQEALNMAIDSGLDLVEIAPNVKPPVCKIMDFGKFLYEQAKKAKIAKKKQHTIVLKEMRFRPKTEEHDYKFKLKHIVEFINQGNKVKVYVQFRGRELAHKELGVKILDKVKADLAEIAEPEASSLWEGRRMSLIFTAKKQ